MPRKENPVEEAFERCRLLALLIDHEYQRARSTPTDQRYVDLGITEKGQKIEDARREIIQAFDELAALSNHLAILDMASAFERMFRSRIATAIGEARKSLQDKYARPGSTPLIAREKLIREHFEGIADIIELIGASLSKEVQEQLRQVRDSRNKFSHGTDLRVAPTIMREEARDALNEAIVLLRPS